MRDLLISALYAKLVDRFLQGILGSLKYGVISEIPSEELCRLEVPASCLHIAILGHLPSALLVVGKTQVKDTIC